MRKKCMEYRKRWEEDIKVLADVQVKHAHMVLLFVLQTTTCQRGISYGPSWRGHLDLISSKM